MKGLFGMRTASELTDRELIELLRAYGRTSHPGKMGRECVVEKILLNEAADRLETLAFAPSVDVYEPITHFFKD